MVTLAPYRQQVNGRKPQLKNLATSLIRSARVLRHVENVPMSIEEPRKDTKLHYDEKVQDLLPIIGLPVSVQIDSTTSKF